MKRVVSMVLAAALGLGVVAASTVGASADWRGGPGWQGGGGWHGGGGPGWHGRGPGWYPRPGWGGRWYRGPGWGGGYYGGWYGSPGAGIAAGTLLGLGLGAAIASQPRYEYEVAPPRGVSWSNHVAYCQDRYRSYNPRTDTFIGYNGRAYRCVGSY